MLPATTTCCVVGKGEPAPFAALAPARTRAHLAIIGICREIAALPLSTTAQPNSDRVATASAQKTAPKAVAAWLFVCCGLIFLMVVVGGVTRLTLSGLSITEWNLVIGVVPPLTHAQWAAEFARYQQVPEYRAVHYGISLADFKTLYFWEYAHRLLGRLIGFAFAVPLVWFWLRGKLPRRLAPALAGILALGFAQGLLGWYMVESGLVHRVEVSQYRLVAHLALALALYAAILWTALGLAFPTAPSRNSADFGIRGPPHPALSPRQTGGEEEFVAGGDTSLFSAASPHPPLRRWRGRAREGAGSRSGERTTALWRRASEALIVLVALTIAAGGFVAGTRAGFIYNTFPLMGGRLVPSEYAQLHPFIRNWFENLAAVQFDHRVLAMTTATAVLLLVAAGWRARLPKSTRVALSVLLATAAMQIALGISTLLLVVPIPLAAAHQAGAVILLTTAIVLRHTLSRSKNVGVL
jgi:cytochrome c oxidase assembly protein subunit 15